LPRGEAEKDLLEGWASAEGGVTRWECVALALGFVIARGLEPARVAQWDMGWEAGREPAHRPWAAG